MQLNNTFVLCLYNSTAKCKGLYVKAAVYLDEGVRLCNELPKENQTDSRSKSLERIFASGKCFHSYQCPGRGEKC